MNSDKMNTITVKSIAVITALPGIYYLISGWKGTLFTVSEILQGNFHSQYMPWWTNLLTIFLYLILVFRLISGYGLYKLKVWGKNLAISVLSIDLVVRFAGFVNLWTYYKRHPEALKLLEELKAAIEAGHAQQVECISVIPSYFIAGTCVLSIILLCMIDFRRLNNEPL